MFKFLVSIPLSNRYFLAKSFEVVDPLFINSSNILLPTELSGIKEKLGPFKG